MCFSPAGQCSEELGRGAFSIVKLAINKETGAKVAVKVIDKTKMSEQYKKNLQMETDILRKGRVILEAKLLLRSLPRPL